MPKIDVDYHTVVEPLPRFASRDGRTRPALRAGEHLFAQTAQTFAYLRSRLESGELLLPEGSGGRSSGGAGCQGGGEGRR